MRIPAWFFFICTLLLLTGFLLGGCASRVVRTVPIPDIKKTEALASFDAFTRRECSPTLDADVTLELNLLGKTERAGGMLQAEEPAFLRYSTLDPLGRSLFILVTDGTGFTMVDNSKARAYTGRVGSRFWHKYFPGNVGVEDLLPLLTGRFADREYTIEDIRGDKTDPAMVWLFTEPSESLRHVIRFDPEAGLIYRHLVEDEEDTVLLDITYKDYDRKTGRCPQPKYVEIRGDSISGTLTICYDRIYPASDLAPSIFELTLPEHYTVKHVD